MGARKLPYIRCRLPQFNDTKIQKIFEKTKNFPHKFELNFAYFYPRKPGRASVGISLHLRVFQMRKIPRTP